MQKNLTYAIVGLTLGLVCGFKASNYNYRSELQASRDAGGAVTAPASAANTPRGDATPTLAEIQASLDNARQNPTDFDLLHRAGHLLLQAQRLDEAAELFLKSQSLRPREGEVLADLAEVNYLRQNFDESVKWARQGLSLQPDFPIAKYYLMASLVETNTNLGEAERILGELEKFKPGDPALAEIRQVIEGTKSGGKKPKTVLSHGPEEPSGGKR